MLIKMCIKYILVFIFDMIIFRRENISILTYFK